MRPLIPILGNSQRLDGGAMFGNVPKSMWTQWAPPDELNRIPLACRCLLVREGNRNILFEAGIGAFFEPKFRERFGVLESEHVLLDSLAKVGVSPADIDVVVLSHLHFDHAGGLLTSYSEGKESELVFPKAKFVVSQAAWQRARNPHPRDKASFIPRLTELLQNCGRLQVESSDRSELLGEGYRFHLSNGHTPGLLMTEIATDEQPVVFVSDLIPGRSWIHLPVTMGYDRYPELLIDEKKALLSDIVRRNGRLFFTHDPEVAICGISRDERGRFSARES